MYFLLYVRHYYLFVLFDIIYISREECLKRAVAAVDYARQKCEDVEFTIEDAARSDKNFLLEVASSAIKAGASTINVADTVGYITPEKFGELLKFLTTNTEGGDKVVSYLQNNFFNLKYIFDY